MDRSFDFGALLRNNKLKHKVKPAHIMNVAVGVQKRLESNLKLRKSVRLTAFDHGRDLGNAVVSESQLKIDHRRAQLEKWKTEKEMKKKEEAAQKKKPFVAGVVRAPLKYVPPPPIPKPSTSGRVTRSQTSRRPKPNPKETPQSFAPKNAGFKPELLNNFPKLPTFAPGSRTKKNKTKNTVTFEPVLYSQVTESVKQSRSKIAPKKQAVTEIKPTRSEPLMTRSARGKVTKALPPKVNPKKMVSTSSSSDSEQVKSVRQVTATKTRKSLNGTNIQKTLTLQSTTSEDKSSDMDRSPNVSKNNKHKSSIRPNYVTNITSSSDSGSIDSKSSDVITVVQSPILPVSTPKTGIPKSESSSEEKLRSPKSPIDLLLTPQQKEMAKKISPCVTLSRGKDNARKEMKWKMDEGLLDDDASDMDSIEHLRWQLDSEIKRMTEMCETWDKISEQSVLPELVQEAVRAATGQSRLLMSKKLSQFASLLESAARPVPGQALVTPADLHGFWDMVYMQVENVDMRFKKLEEWRARGWAEETVAPVRRKAVKPVAKKAVSAPATSRLREMIAAARKAKNQPTDQIPVDNPATQQAPADEEKTFDAGFFSVKSPIAKSAKVTPRNTPRSLLKAVLSSEAKKSATKNSASFAMLRASLLSKNIDCEGIAPLPPTPEPTPINLYATPGRSILKSSNKSTKKKSGKKSIKILHFNESTDSSFVSIVSDEKTENINYANVVLQDLEAELKDVPSVVRKGRKKTLTRQQAVDSEPEPMMTRRQRKSLLNQEQTETEETLTPKESSRKKKQTDTQETTKVKTPRQASKVLQEAEVNLIQLETPKAKSRRSKIGIENETEKPDLPKRSSRRRKSVSHDMIS